MPNMPPEETPHGWKQKRRPPGPSRPPHLTILTIEQCHRLTMLQLLDAGVEFTTTGRLPNGAERPMVRCPRCGARRNALYTRPGVAGIGCRGCFHLAYASERTLRRPACSLERIAELVQRAKTAKTPAARARWRRKAVVAGAEFMRRENVRQERREALLQDYASQVAALVGVERPEAAELR
jgi:hypothetical protein